MKIIKLKKNNERQALKLAVSALKQGKVVAYPTDTSYGLGGDALSDLAVRKIYKIKVRGFSQPVHILAPSLIYAKKIVKWNALAQKFAAKFLPGPLSMALPLKSKNKNLIKLSAGTGYLGIRMPKNGFALKLAKKLGRPITATSANPSKKLAKGFDPYSASDIISQFERRKWRPDLIIDAGKLPKVKPSTFIKITGGEYQVLRDGPISKRQLSRV